MSVLNRPLRLLHVSVITLTACVGLSCRTEVARPEQGYAGTWVMTLGQRVFIVLTIEPHGQAYTARIQAPASFNLPAAGSPLRTRTSSCRSRIGAALAPPLTVTICGSSSRLQRILGSRTSST